MRKMIFLLWILSMTAEGAIRLGQVSSGTAEINLDRIVYLATSSQWGGGGIVARIQTTPWRRFVQLETQDNPPEGMARNNTQQLDQYQAKLTSLLTQFSKVMEPSTRAFFSHCFDPGVKEFLVARLPARTVLGIEQAVWIICFTLDDPQLTQPYLNCLLDSCRPQVKSKQQEGQDLPTERRLAGFPLTTVNLPGKQIHFLRGRQHVLVSPNLFLFQDVVKAPEESSSAEDSATQVSPPPDALISWSVGRSLSPLLGSHSLPGGEGEHQEWSRFNRLLAQWGVEQVAVSFKDQPHHLEICFTIKGARLAGRRIPTRRIQPELLNSIPAHSTLMLMGAGLDTLGLPADLLADPSTYDLPFSLGIEVPFDKRDVPTEWYYGGGYAEDPLAQWVKAASAEIVSGTRSPNNQNLPELPFPVPPKQENTGTRSLLYGNAPQRGFEERAFEMTKEHPRKAPTKSVKNFFGIAAENSLLAGMILPDLLLLPYRWDLILSGEEAELDESWYLALAPLEFSLNRLPDGLELRLGSNSPLSPVLFLLDLFFVFQIDYHGDWERLQSTQGISAALEGRNPLRPE
jgi:hypothetical protein